MLEKIRNFMRLWWFQTKQFASTKYFVQTLIATTLTALCLQALLLYSGENLAGAESLAWLRAGITGSWAVSCLSAGILGFQRYQGVLAHHVFAKVGLFPAILPIVVSCVAFGLLSFVVAFAGAVLLNFSVTIGSLEQLALGAPMFLCASLLVALFMSLFFLLTPNALVYEPVLAVFIVLFTGVYGYPGFMTKLELVLYLFPLSYPVQIVQHGFSADGLQLYKFLMWILCIAIWSLAVWQLKKLVLVRVAKKADLEVI